MSEYRIAFRVAQPRTDEPGDSVLTLWERHFGCQPERNRDEWMAQTCVNSFVGLQCRDAIRRTWELLRTLDTHPDVVEPILRGLLAALEIMYFG